MSNPKIIFTKDQWKQIENMASYACTGEEIAHIVQVDYDTLDSRIQEKYHLSTSDFLKKYQAPGKMSLRRQQYKSALEDKNITMLIWLGKQHLGQTDKQELFGKDGTALTINWIMPEGSHGKA